MEIQEKSNMIIKSGKGVSLENLILNLSFMNNRYTRTILFPKNTKEPWIVWREGDNNTSKMPLHSSRKNLIIVSHATILLSEATHPQDTGSSICNCYHYAFLTIINAEWSRGKEEYGTRTGRGEYRRP